MDRRNFLKLLAGAGAATLAYSAGLLTHVPPALSEKDRERVVIGVDRGKPGGDHTAVVAVSRDGVLTYAAIVECAARLQAQPVFYETSWFFPISPDALRFLHENGLLPD